jgi:hypothetical protein
MFVGHYAAAFAARGARPAVSLGALFVAVQLVDFGWAALVLAGVEKARIVPGFLEASDLDLYFMPYTHSLVATVIWALAGGALYAFARRGGGKAGAGAIVAAAVASHWALDLLVHAPDLPVLHDDGPKLGFGLWNSLLLSQMLEIGLLLLGLIVYIRATRPRGLAGRLAPWGLFAALCALQAYSHLAPPSPSAAELAQSALAGYTVLSLLAFATDATRRPA